MLTLYAHPTVAAAEPAGGVHVSAALSYVQSPRHRPVNARFAVLQHKLDVSAGGPVVAVGPVVEGGPVVAVGPVGVTVVAVDDRSPNNVVVDAAVVAMDAAPCLPTLWEEVPFTAEPSPCASLTNVHLLAVASHVVGEAQH